MHAPETHLSIFTQSQKKLIYFQAFSENKCKRNAQKSHSSAIMKQRKRAAYGRMKMSHQ